MNVYALNADMLVRAAPSCSTEIFNWSLYLQALPTLVYRTWRTSMPCGIASCNETYIKRLLGLHSKSVYVHGGGGQFQHKPNTLSTITTISGINTPHAISGIIHSHDHETLQNAR